MITEPELVRAAERFLGVAVRSSALLEGGDEATVLLVETDGDQFVLHASPAWRTRTELEWTHGVTRHAQKGVPQAVAPVRRGGRTVFECKGRCVAVFPFVNGQMLHREDPVLRSQAATILAAIHNALLDWRGGSRPPSGGRRPALTSDPPELRDPGLDASVRPLAIELAGATFEMCRDDEHILQLDRADQFVTSYRAAGGPLSEHELDVLLPLIRLWSRDDARGSLAHDGQTDDAYAARQMRAFRTLASCEWRPSSVTGG